MIQKTAFTLAEVLITLGIIGIVAALTLPTIINNTRGKELQSQLLKAYSVLRTAINKMNYDEGQVVNGTNYPAGTFMPVFRKYFISVNDMCKNSVCENATVEDGVWSYISKTYKTYNNKDCYMSRFDDGQVFINGGMLILVENADDYISISVDVNGHNKKPNRWGHDVFSFEVLENGKLLPMGAPGTTQGNDYGFSQYCSITSNTVYNGMACTYRALTDKDYFKNLPK